MELMELSNIQRKACKDYCNILKEIKIGQSGFFITCACVLSYVLLFAMPWTVAHQASLSMGLSRQENWMGLPCPPPGDLPNLGTETRFPALAGEFFTTEQSEAVAAKSLPSCLTLCDPIDGSPPGSAVPGILQARTVEWVAISFSNAWKWKVKVKLVMSDPQRPHGLQPTRLLHPWDFQGKSTGVGCHCLLWSNLRGEVKNYGTTTHWIHVFWVFKWRQIVSF